MSKSIVYELLTRQINSPAGPFYNKVCSEVITIPCIENSNKNNVCNLTFRFHLEEGYIRSARVEVFADPFFTAGCLWCVWSVKGKTVLEAHNSLGILDISKDFGFVPKYYYELVFPKVIALALKTLNS